LQLNVKIRKLRIPRNKPRRSSMKQKKQKPLLTYKNQRREIIWKLMRVPLVNTSTLSWKHIQMKNI